MATRRDANYTSSKRLLSRMLSLEDGGKITRKALNIQALLAVREQNKATCLLDER